MITPVILCGGAGKRLWPLSRPDLPKPFVGLVDGESTFDMTLERIASDGFADPVIVTGAVHRQAVVTALGTRSARLVLEPAGRNTAPAIAAAALTAKPDDVLMVLAADHLIRDIAGFRADAEVAARAAEQGNIVVFGIRPSHAETGYGYISPGPGEGGAEWRPVSGFKEKPDAATAARYVSEGYLWNSGMFVLTAATALDELERHAPEILNAVRGAVADAGPDDALISLEEVAFHACPSEPFDTAVMEKTERAVVREAGFDWSDLGGWRAVRDVSGADDAGNVRQGDATLVETRNAFVLSSRPKVGLLGVDDVVVVATDEAVLVTRADKSDQLRDLVDAIDAEPEKVAGDFIRHARPWGNYQSLDTGPSYQVKRLVVHPGARLSLQKHQHRAEHWTVVQGTAEVTIDERVFSLVANEAAYIPLGAVHRLANHGPETLVVIEVQHGDYLGEDDIIRLEDDFGRRD